MTSRRKVHNVLVLPRSPPLHPFPHLLSFSLHIHFATTWLRSADREGRDIADARREKSYVV